MNIKQTFSPRKFKFLAILSLIYTVCISGVAAESVYNDTSYSANYSTFLDQFVDRLSADVRINHIFFRNSPEQLKKQLLVDLCQNPMEQCGSLTGRHIVNNFNLELSETEFSMLKQHLQDVLPETQLPATSKHNLLQQISSHKPNLPSAKLPIASL